MANQELHVIFGAGPVGQAVARELVQRGKTVKMVNRSGQRPGGVPDNVTVAAGDVFDVNVAKNLAQGATHVYQCTNPPYDKWPEQFPTLQANTLEAAASAGAKYIVMENVYMYGDTDGQPIRKICLTTRIRGRARCAHRWQKMCWPRISPARCARRWRGRRIFMDRACWIRQRAIGCSDSPSKSKAASTAGNLDAQHSYTYIDDIGQALVILGERDEALGQAWHVPNAAATTTRQFVNLIFEELKQPARMSAVSKMMMRLAGLFIPGARETVEMFYEFEKDFVVDSGKFTQAFGLQATPHREGIAATVAWYKANYNHAK